MSPVDRTPVFEAEVRTWEQAIAICHKQHAEAESSEERWRIGVVITELEMNLDGAQVRLQVERALLAELAKVAPAPRYRVVSVQEYVALVLTGAAVHQWNVLPGETLASSLAKWSRSASDGRGCLRQREGEAVTTHKVYMTVDTYNTQMPAGEPLHE